MKHSIDIDERFASALRDNQAPISLTIHGVGGEDSYTIPLPDKRLGFELSLAIKSYKMRREKELKR